MKLKMAILCGSLAAIVGILYFKIRKDPQLGNTPQSVVKAINGEARGYVDTGLVDLKSNDSKAAESAFKKAIEIDPGYTRARAVLAALYLAIGDQKKGEHELLLATKSDPESEELLHILGTFDSQSPYLTDYENLYRDLLKKQPHSLPAKKKLIELLIAR